MMETEVPNLRRALSTILCNAVRYGTFSGGERSLGSGREWEELGESDEARSESESTRESSAEEVL